MTNRSVVSQHHDSFFAYPNPSQSVIHARTQEATLLGIQIPPAGSSYKILGQGYCGVVFQGLWQGKQPNPIEVAIKVRRLDASRPNLRMEAMALKRANENRIGPKLHDYSDNFIVMEYVSGPNFLTWLQDQHSTQEINHVIQTILFQAFQLDTLGIDHGNLRCVTEHILFRNHTPVLIDFSSCSFKRQVSNVTTLMQGLFWGTVIPQFIANFRPLPEKATLIPLLQSYKKEKSPTAFDQLLDEISLH